jgi:PKD repeat protein
VKDNGGLSSSATLTITANPNQPPVASATANPTTGYAPLAVAFSSAGSSDPDGSIQSRSWVFGDGGTSTSQNPSHTYNSPGTYTAVLTVKDNKGALSTSSVTISVEQDPKKVIFVADIGMSLIVSSGANSAKATITVTDGTGAVRSGVQVTGQWSGVVTSGNTSAKTDATGKISFTSKSTSSPGTFTFTVTKLSATGPVYDASRNVETKDSISTP